MVIADRFDVRMEVEAVYLRGDFSVVEIDQRWVLSAPLPELSVGADIGGLPALVPQQAPESKGLMLSWRDLGLPFYPHAVEYSYTAHLDSVPVAATIDVPAYEATALSVVVNGHEILLHVNGRVAHDITAFLRVGVNDIRVRVCGSMKNLLGPHFPETAVRKSAWPDMWRQGPLHQPAAASYDLLAYGLYETPLLTVRF